MIGMIAIAAAAQASMEPINIPYQAMPALMAYTDCVGAHLRQALGGRNNDAAEVDRANADALASCREVRARELARGIAAVGDRKTRLSPEFRSRKAAQAAVGKAFDRFDTDYEVQ